MLDNTWAWADIVSLTTGFVLFSMTVWIGKNQEKSVYLIRDLTQEIKYLQTGLSGLEIYEKMGVIEQGLKRLSQGEDRVAPALLHDCLALLPVLQFCDADLANNYVDNLLRKSLYLLTDYYSLDKQPMSGYLIQCSLKEIKLLESIESKKNLAEEMKCTLAIYLDSLKSQDSQKAKEICSFFLQENVVNKFLILESGDPLKIMKLLCSSNLRGEK